MKQLRFSFTLALALIACAAFAQTAPKPPASAIAPAPPARDKSENIIIRKNGDKKEKITIVVDGDNITINGKPAEDFKDSDIEIIHDNDSDIDLFPPMPPTGGLKEFTRSFNNFRGNNAALGIVPADDDNGAKINEVTKGSAADKAGLKEGDVIIKINDTKIDDADDVYDAISKYKPSDKVTVTYLRDKKESTVTATLDKNIARPFVWNNSSNAFDMLKLNNNRNFSFEWNIKPRLGIRVQDTENSQGVTVMDINDDDSPAAKAGLKENDVITEVNGKAVQSVKDVKDQIKDLKPGDDVKLQYKRNGTSQSATVHIPKPLQTSDL